MTREEAIEVLGMVEAHGLADEAKRMAIEALKFQGKAEVVISQLREDRDRLLTLVDAKRCEDAISRQVVWDVMQELWGTSGELIDRLMALPSVTPKQRWIPVSERLPEDLEAVNITWVNHEPEPYYHDIKDKNFVATGIHYRGQWYWYSTTCADYLGEYGSNDIDKVDDAIEIVAWMPLQEPYKVEPQESEEQT